MNKRRIIPSLVLNSLIFVLVIIGLIVGYSVDHFDGQIFKYFTVLSNVFMSIVSLIYVIYLILILNKKVINTPKTLEIFKLVSTVCVVITFLTVCLVLAPITKDATMLFSNACSLLHVAVPLLSLTTWLLFEHSSNKIHFPESIYGIIPLVIYTIIYTALTLTHIKSGKPLPGYDWYGFMTFGLKAIPLLVIGMIGFTFLISWLLWLGNKKIDIKYESMKRIQYKRFWSMFINGLIFILVTIGVIVRFVHDSASWSTLKYFTIQSNIFIGIVCLIYLIFEGVEFNKKEINKHINLIKLMFTVYVAITFIVTVFALTPGAAILKLKNWPVSRLYVNANVLFHVFVPLLAILNWLLFEHCNNIEFKKIFYSFIYVVIYSIFYITIAYTHIGKDGKIPMEYDWYKFCSFGPGMTFVICNVLLGVTFLFTWLFRLLNRKINIYKDISTKKVGVNKH